MSGNWMERASMWIFESVLMPLFIVTLTLGLIGGIVGGVIYALGDEFTLKKVDWACSATYTVDAGYYMQSGNTQFWVPATETRCSQYTRK